MFLTLETRGSQELDAGLKLQVGQQSVPIQNGAVLHVRLEHMFSVVRNGEVQCTWEPYITMGGPKIEDWAAAGQSLPFSRNEIGVEPVGAPVAIIFYHDLGQAPREFKIGGLVATVLAETSVTTILRDPKPAIGMRIVQTGKQSSKLHFAEIESKLTPTSGNSAQLEIQGRGNARGTMALGDRDDIS
jgi:hypothetical protein